ncbi:hypothetical protein AK812_SmicGene34433 [Symbiodinium microadriaticum]|uniref:EF-hand domain-containing protein n=1 Tax=Symbiodinium microadriaticum TaxID=2951 RepID=A0A1Q9CP10_SYMMI|nr:hypothetical protein AK812_SmicGene34433 [Symbiodinium microadriaticum]
MAPCRFSQVVFVATTCLCALPFSTALEACPKNTYRSSPIVFSCGGGFGNTYLTVPANQSVPLTIPLGVEGFRITANSSTGRVRLQLRDAASDVVVVAQDHGLINGSVRAGVYKDVGIVYSGNLSSANISLYLLGALTAPMKLSFATTASSGIARVHLAYTFERVLECSSPPAGCHEYHEEDARWQVQVWSRWARSEYQNASRAWQALAEDRAEKNGVSWPEWPEVWSVFVGNSSIQVAGEEWQPSFRYLDADRDGFVSQEEFELGFHGGGQARGRDEAAVTMEEVIGKTEGAVRSHLWIVAGAASVLLLAAVLCWRCRSSGAKRVARSVSKLSRDDVPSGPGQALKTGRAAAAASLPTKEHRCVAWDSSASKPLIPCTRLRMAACKARGLYAVGFFLCLLFSDANISFSQSSMSLRRRQGLIQLGLASGLVGAKDANAARLIKDKGELVYDPKTGQRVRPPCETVCVKECLAIVGLVNEKNKAYCEQRCQDDCAAGDGFGSTETYDADNERITKDADKNPAERFAEWAVERNADVLDSFMKMPGAKPGLEPDSLTSLGEPTGPSAPSAPTPSASKGTRGLPDSTGAGAVHGEGLWLFPHIGQALPSFLTQESFRYVPLATQEEVPLQHAGVGHPPSSESFTGWHAQPGSFSLPASSASGLQSFAMAPEFGLGHMAPSMALGPLGQAGQDPRREAMLHAAWAARLTQGSPWTSAPASAASPSIAEPPVRHAELAGPVQVMPAEIPVVGTGAEETAADRWGDVAAVISPQRLSAEI